MVASTSSITQEDLEFLRRLRTGEVPMADSRFSEENVAILNSRAKLIELSAPFLESTRSYLGSSSTGSADGKLQPMLVPLPFAT